MTSTAQQATINALENNDSAEATPTKEISLGELENGKEAVVTESGDELYVMNALEPNATRLTTLLTGHHMLIVDGPRTGNGFTWWQVQLIEDRVGWVVEGMNGEQWIAPSLDDPQVTVLKDITPSNLFIGARCQLGKYTYTNVAVRDQPSRDGQVIKRLDTTDNEDVVTIIDGPLNAERTRWWKVRLTGNRNTNPEAPVGWVAEGEDALKFLDTIYPAGKVSNVRGGHMEIGDTVRATSSGDGMRLRAEPSRNSAAVTTLGLQVNATVLDGPIEREGFTWWKIKRSDGKTGWVATAPGWLEVYEKTQ
jgi:hypothetical protein